ncbi:Uncharacterized protein ChrSV_2449 [Chromobacterium vaccinii]|nr:Uncharacterized protein ChrSW_2449 [Chromobacterium vaccinii]QND89906.1 Uncharacterized protein ChrSV_2449 [Chromobacterium vaccinii]
MYSNGINTNQAVNSNWSTQISTQANHSIFNGATTNNLTPTDHTVLTNVVAAAAPDQASRMAETLLNNHNITITIHSARQYLTQLENLPRNQEIPIIDSGGISRRRAFKMNNNNDVSSVVWHPPSDPTNMRVAPGVGAAGDMLQNGPRPLTGNVISMTSTLTRADLSNDDRTSQNQAMGNRSAQQESQIPNSEWLHLRGHSLGGPTHSSNLVAGPHALNTAMIPLERLVSDAANRGVTVGYNVDFFTHPQGGANDYVHHAQITITLPNQPPRIWTLEADPNKLDTKIDKNTLEQIQNAVEQYAQSIGL